MVLPKIIRNICCWLLFILAPVILMAQQDSVGKLYQGILLDEVMIKAVQSGFDVDAFIVRVKTDTTFYKAFRNLRRLSYKMLNDIEILDRDNQTKASYASITHQDVVQGCRSMRVLQEKVQGNFFKEGRKYRYYTAYLYDHLFFTHGTVCMGQENLKNTSSNFRTRYEDQLRQLIFNPGKPIKGIPGIGKNVEIFDPPTRGCYQFRLSRQDYLGEPCYVFKAVPRPECKNELVINELKTWFRVSDFTIVAREYSLSYKTLVYDFDVKMQVRLKTFKQLLVPYEINYQGNWHVFTRSREKASFTAIFTDFE